MSTSTRTTRKKRSSQEQTQTGRRGQSTEEDSDINTSRDQLRKDIKAVLAKYRQCWQKHMIDFEEYGSAVAERTIMESINKAVLPAVLNAAEENCVEVIEFTMIRYPRGECAHRLERIIFEIWQKYLNCVRHELTWQKLQHDIEELQNQLKTSEEHCREAKDALEVETERSSELRQDLTDANDRHDAYRRFLREAADRNKDLQCQLQGATKKVERLESQLQEAQAGSILSSKPMKRKSGKDQLEDARYDNAEVIRRLEGFKADSALDKARLVEAQVENSLLKDRLLETEIELFKARAEKAEAREQRPQAGVKRSLDAFDLSRHKLWIEETKDGNRRLVVSVQERDVSALNPFIPEDNGSGSQSKGKR